MGLGDSKYVLLESYRRDGTGVRTPVWVVPRGESLLVWTPGKSHKARRLRRDPRAALAPCNASGSEILGPWQRFHAHVSDDPADVAELRKGLRRKYGWHVPLIDFSLWFRGERLRDFVQIELTPDVGQGP